MARNFGVRTTVSLLCLIFCNISLAQDQADTPLMCNQTDSMDFDPSQLAGTWWEVARNPASADNYACVQVNFTEMLNNNMNIATTYSNTYATYPYVNQTMYANITLESEDMANGFNISFINGLTNTTATVFKLLATDYQSYAFVCGYQNVTNNATFFGIVLTRDRTPDTTTLDKYESMASTSYYDFLNGSMTLIPQDATCWANGAETISVSRLYSVLAFYYLIRNLLS